MLRLDLPDDIETIRNCRERVHQCIGQTRATVGVARVGIGILADYKVDI